MAVNKSKRSIHLAQPKPERRSPNPEQILRPKYGLRISPAGSQPRQTRPHARKAAQPAEQMPVRAHVYRTIADMNGGLEHAIEGLQTLLKINYLRSDGLNEIQNLICQVRAQANRELMTVLNEREAGNAGHYQNLRIPPENDTRT
jgi:hypothetical protein